MELAAIIIALIVPIGIAIWTVRSSAKDTAKKIAALEESTTKQVESIKELARIQIEITSIQLQKELAEARTGYLQASEKSMNAIDDRFRNSHGVRHLGIGASSRKMRIGNGSQRLPFLCVWLWALREISSIFEGISCKDS